VRDLDDVEDRPGGCHGLSGQGFSVLTSTFIVELPESNPPLYQGFCVVTCRFVRSRSRSVPLVTCGFIFGS
jgi:hypothetical protein